MFRSTQRITVIAGKGGDGCISFRREKYVPKGGPDGGDGGKGGDCIIKVNPHIRTLSHITNHQIFKADNGKPGKGKKQHGADGKDIVVEVPIGTEIIDAQTGKILYDLTEVKEIIIAKGGKGGLGNWNFRSPTNQIPTYASKGEVGEKKELILNLKLISDIGLVGFPNSGKSSIIRKLTKATPKVADYPFTTTEPVLGVIGKGNKQIIIADIPGIIENAHLGVGLGLEFLKHIERAQFIVIVLDITDNPLEKARILIKELSYYKKNLLKKIKIVTFNKIDLLSEKELEIFKETKKDKILSLVGIKTKVNYVSALQGIDIETLSKDIISLYNK